ncbi:MAG: carbon-nitrogen hydrolase family protein [archaeon]|nr:carbon-nitrogen hydrolase family protein [archaeon]MCP8320755.1 carbon-nitrogen hydrolase family protein [archaeon]
MARKVLGGCEQVRVAAIQIAPVFMDKERTIKKAIQYINEAASNDAELIVFPEAFIPGYPAYYTGGFESSLKEWANYNITLQENSVVIPSEDTEILAKAAREAGAYVVIGCNELSEKPGNRTVYNTLLFLGSDGSILGKHRKLMPTYTERTYWGWGDISDLRVFDTNIGRLGGLICWENHMILIKAAMIELGEEIHIAVWPGSWSIISGPSLVEPDTAGFGGTCDLQPAIREHAFEAGAFVVSVSGLLRSEDIPNEHAYIRDNPHVNYKWAVGGSAVVSPFGNYLAEPVFNQEKIVYANLDPSLIKAAKVVFDANGHYARPDVAQLMLSWKPWAMPTRVHERIMAAVTLPSSELRRIAEKYEIPPEKLEKVLDELLLR